MTCEGRLTLQPPSDSSTINLDGQPPLDGARRFMRFRRRRRSGRRRRGRPANPERNMSSFNQFKEAFDAVLNAARRITDLSIGLLQNHHCLSLSTFPDDLRRLRRDLPHLVEEAIAAFPGRQQSVANLNHNLRCVLEDADGMAKWADSTSVELAKLFVAPGDNADLRYAGVKENAFKEAERYRQAVLKSCNAANASVDAAVSVALASPVPSKEDEALAALDRATAFNGTLCRNVADLVALAKEMAAFLEWQIVADPALRTATSDSPSQKLKRKLRTEAERFGLRDVTARLGELTLNPPWGTVGEVLCDLEWFVAEYDDAIGRFRDYLRQVRIGISLAEMAGGSYSAAEWQAEAGKLWAEWREHFPDYPPPPLHRAPAWNRDEFEAAIDT